MNKLCRIFLLLSLLVFVPAVVTEVADAADLANAANSQTETIQKLNQFIDGWHDDAAHARLAYFDKMTADAVYIGTDQSERWTRDEFKIWAKPAFSRPGAWAFTVINRHIAMTEDQSVLWFDEQLQTKMGVCQASGVVRQTAVGFKIAHYQLSLTVPNALIDYLAEGVKKQAQSEKNKPSP